MSCIRPRPQPPNISRPQPPVKPGPPPEFTFESQAEATRFEYVYGIKDLRISGEEYKPKSIYVTKPIEVSGNIVEVSLDSKEVHPLFDEVTGEAPSRQTSVEYYLAYEANPNVDDWHSILPEHEKEVQGELLMFDNASTAAIRFPAITEKEGLSQARVFKDGVKLANSRWSFGNGGRQIQLLEGYNPSSIYTIDYKPNAELHNPWAINVPQNEMKRVQQVATFPNGTNRNKTVVLPHYPYIDYERINQDESYDPNTSSYKPVEIELIEASIALPGRKTTNEVKPYDPTIKQEAYMYNATDYKTDDWKMLTPYSLKDESRYEGFEYWQEGNKIYFSETFNRADIMDNLVVSHGNATIRVKYETLISNFRMKIILRRNGPGISSVSPVVHSYSLKFKSMR